jgi:hypothetical protein
VGSKNLTEYESNIRYWKASADSRCQYEIMMNTQYIYIYIYIYIVAGRYDGTNNQ